MKEVAASEGTSPGPVLQVRLNAHIFVGIEWARQAALRMRRQGVRS